MILNRQAFIQKLHVSSSPEFWAKVAAMVAVGLVVMLAWSAANLTWTLWAPESVEPGSQTERVGLAPGASSASDGETGLEQVALLHLFGQPDGPGVGVQPVDAPETRLKLSLKGVVAHLDPTAGFAVIADAGGRDGIYVSGAELPGGAVLEQVFGDRVILSRQGRLEMLRLPRVTDLDGGAPVTRKGGDAAAAAKLSELQRAWQTNPAAILEDVDVQPVSRGGKLQGFAVKPRNDAGMFRELGLEAGDVITRINGLALNTSAAPAELLQHLQGATTLRLSIERRGRPQTVTMRLTP